MAAGLAISSDAVKVQSCCPGARKIGPCPEADEHRAPLPEREESLLGDHLGEREVGGGLGRHAAEGEISERATYTNGHHSVG